MAKSDWQLAQLNVGRVVAPTDSPQLADFMNALDGINALAEGSPGRALLLAAGEGLALSDLVDQVLTALPALPASRAHALADTLGRPDGGFSTFMDLLRAAISAALRDVLHGRGDLEQERLVSLLSLEAWGETWHALTRLQDETERFSLDKRQAVVAGLGLLRPPGPGLS